MKILHISDTHGKFPELVGDFDVVVHSGDLMPNRRGSGSELGFQEDWCRQKARRFASWLRDRPMLWCPGNHDFFDASRVLEGVVNLSLGVHEVDGVRFYGFPFVPYCGGGWNYECHEHDLKQRMNHVVDLVNDRKLDVLVAHCPPYGVLDDVYGEKIGNRALIHAMDYMFDRPLVAILCGHVHESAGVVEYEWTTVSNAACTQRIIEV